MCGHIPTTVRGMSYSPGGAGGSVGEGGVITRSVQRCWIDRTRAINHVATHAIYRRRGRMGRGVHHARRLHLPMASRVVVVAPTTLARDSAGGRLSAEHRYIAVEWITRGKSNGARDFACTPGRE